MATTAEINDLLEPWLKNTEFTSDIQKKIKEVYSSLLDNLAKNAKNIKLETGTLDLGGFLGTDKKVALANSLKFISLQKEVLDRIQKAVKNSAVNIDPAGIKLGDILGAGPKDNIFTYTKFQSIRRNILDKIQKVVKDGTVNIDPAGIKLGDILGAGSKDNIFTYTKFQSIRRNVLDKIQKSVKDGTVNIDPTGIKLGDILGDLPSMGMLSRMRLGRLRSKILKSIEAQADGITVSKEGVKLTDILGDMPAMGLFSRLRLGKLRSKIFSMIEGQTKKMAGEDAKQAGGEAKPAGLRVFAEEAKPVTLAGIDKEAMQQLSGVIGAKQVVAAVDPKKETKAEPPAGFSKWMGPIALLIGGLGSLVAGLMSSGPGKGLLTMIGKGGIMTGLKMAAKMVGKIVSKALRFLPLIGTIIDLADAYTRFKNSDVVGGIISTVGGLGGLFLFAGMPIIGNMLSWGASVLNAYLDYKAGGSSKEASAKKGTMIWDALKSAAKWIGDKIYKILRYTPVIGTGIRLYESYQTLKSGNVGKGILQIGGALATMVPFFGPLLSGGVDYLIGFVEGKAEKATKEGKPTTSGDVIMGALKSAAKWIGSKVLKILRYTPVLGTAMRLYDTYQSLKSGNIGKSLFDLGGALATILPIPFGGILAAGIDKLAGFVFSKGEDQGGKAEKGSNKSLWEIMKEKIVEKVKAAMNRLIEFGTGIKNIFTGDFKKGLGNLANATSGVPIIGSLFGTLNDWFGEPKVDAGKAEGGKPKSMWQIFKEYLVQKIKNSFRRIVQFGTGLKNLFSGNFKKSLGNFADATAGIPLIGTIFGKLNDWFGEPKADEGAKESKGKPKTLVQMMKDAAFKKMKAAWDSTPKWIKWGIRKILPQSIVDKLDAANPPDESENPENPENQEAAGADEAPRTSWKEMMAKARAKWAAKQAGGEGAPIPAQDFAGWMKPGGFMGMFKRSPVINTAKDYVIGAKSGGPIEQKLDELVQSVNRNMQSLSDQIAKSIETGVGNIRPTVMPPPPINIPAPQQAPIESSRAPSYAAGKIYNQRAKFYALYGE